MAWVYKLSLTGYRDAKTVQDDWESNTPGGVVNEDGGVQVSGSTAAIVSVRRNPEYENMADLDYVEAVSEDKQIPDGDTYSLVLDDTM